MAAPVDEEKKSVHRADRLSKMRGRKNRRDVHDE
jgi:hypothetical protein